MKYKFLKNSKSSIYCFICVLRSFSFFILRYFISNVLSNNHFQVYWKEKPSTGSTASFVLDKTFQGRKVWMKIQCNWRSFGLFREERKERIFSFPVSFNRYSLQMLPPIQKLGRKIVCDNHFVFFITYNVINTKPNEQIQLLIPVNFLVIHRTNIFSYSHWNLKQSH